MQFITSNIIAVVEETKLDPDTFQLLESVWVRAKGIPKIARIEFAVTELARLVGEPEEIHIPSLGWRYVWLKVASKDPSMIKGKSEVFINKKGKRITWYYSDKMSQFPPAKRSDDDDDFDSDDEETTDEEVMDSQESQEWQKLGGRGSGSQRKKN